MSTFTISERITNATTLNGSEIRVPSLADLSCRCPEAASSEFLHGFPPFLTLPGNLPQERPRCPAVQVGLALLPSIPAKEMIRKHKGKPPGSPYHPGRVLGSKGPLLLPPAGLAGTLL